MPARSTLPRDARPRPFAGSVGVALAGALAMASLAGCRPSPPADGMVDPPGSSSRPVATLGPDDAVPAVTEGSVAAPVSPTSAEQMHRAIAATGRVALQVDFEADGTDLHANAAPVLEEVVTLLRDDPGLALSIDAHTDDRGDPDLDRKLTRQRAETVRAALIAHGIEPDRLLARGFGADHPVAGRDGTDRRNRRVELVRRD